MLKFYLLIYATFNILLLLLKNPTFSSSKMKELSPLMQICIGKFIQKIEENVDKEVDVMSLLKKFTMDTIW
jgi:hypothetical protein